MAIEPQISLGVKPANISGSLSDMYDMQSKMLAIKKAKATMDADIAQRQSESQSAGAKATVDTANVQPLIAQQAAQTSESQTGAQKAQFNLQDAQHQKTVEQITGLIGDESVRKGDPKGINAALDAAAQNAIQYGANPNDVKATIEPLRQIAQQNPQAVQPALINLLRQGLGVGGQAQVIQPSGPGVNTGQVQYQANTNPLAATPVGPVPGTVAQNQIPVGTQQFDPTRGAQTLTAPGGGSGPQAAPALGVPQTVEGIVAPVTQDWADTTTQARTATPNIAILQKIKQHSEGAIVGYAADKRAVLNSLADALGIPASELAKTDTDLLMKNANMRALTGGNTDSARALSELANPNIHMNKEAIRETVDQIVGQQKMVLAKQQHMQQFVNDPQRYTQELTTFNSVADPQVFEYAAKDKKDRAKMLEGMSVSDKKSLVDKMQKLGKMGINP